MSQVNVLLAKTADTKQWMETKEIQTKSLQTIANGIINKWKELTHHVFQYRHVRTTQAEYQTQKYSLENKTIVIFSIIIKENILSLFDCSESIANHLEINHS